MAKKILIAENSDAVRRAAEQALRGAGFDVIAVGSVDRAREALQFARPDLIIVGSDLKTADNKALYERLQADPKTASLPLLVIQSPGDSDLSYPSEVVLTQPVDTNDLIQRVTVFAGLAPRSAQPGVAGLHIDDRTLDSALGLDGIDVVNSEVMDQTKLGRTNSGSAKSNEPMIGFDVASMSDTTITRKGERSDSGRLDTNRVESKMIREDKPPAQPTKGGTGALEIVRDQSAYFQHLEERPTDQPMDFSSFMDELREDIKGGAQAKPVSKSIPPSPAKKTSDDELKFKPNSASLETVTVSSARPVLPQTKPPSPASSQPVATSSVGVEKFIDQFKKEIEQLRTDDPIEQLLDSSARASASGGLKWEESLETISPDHVRLFSRQLAHDIAEKIAEKIVSKIDADRLLALITQEVMARRKKS